MEAFSGRKTLQEVAVDQAMHLIQGGQWKPSLLEGARELFTQGRNTQAKDGKQAKEAELIQQYCFAEAEERRQASDEAGVAEKDLNCSEARGLRKN
jgi:hypothetical protein